MQITLIGWLLIPMGMILALLFPRQLFFATIFSALFSATAIINIGSGESASGVQVYLYFSSLLVARTAFDGLMHLQVKVSRSIRRPLMYLFGFVLVCFVSIGMPLWIDGRLAIMSAVLLDMTTTPLRFTSANLTGIAYLLLGACSAAVIAQRTVNPDDFRRSVKVYTWSGLFVSFWGMVQLACHALHIPYPALIFNSSATPSAQGFDSLLGDSGLQRISSVAVEPSLFAASLLTIIPFSLMMFLGEGSIVSRRVDRWIFALMFLSLLSSTSSTAYVGLGVLVVVAMRYLKKYRGIRLRYLVLLGSGVFLVGAGYVLVAPFRDLLGSALFNKSEGYSALERAKSIVYAFSYFREYPILGIGWSSATSHDTVVKLLSNCGVVGLASFVMFVGSILAPLRKRVAAVQPLEGAKVFDSPALLLLINLLVLLSVAVMDGFPYVFGHFWVVLGFAMSAAVVSKDHPFLFTESSRR